MSLEKSYCRNMARLNRGGAEGYSMREQIASILNARCAAMINLEVREERLALSIRLAKLHSQCAALKENGYG